MKFADALETAESLRDDYNLTHPLTPLVEMAAQTGDAQQAVFDRAGRTLAITVYPEPDGEFGWSVGSHYL